MSRSITLPFELTYKKYAKAHDLASSSQYSAQSPFSVEVDDARDYMQLIFLGAQGTIYQCCSHT